VLGLVVGLVLGLVLAPETASAYCRTTSCEAMEAAWQVCTPPAADDCGKVLYWPKQCVGFTLQKDASSQVSLDEAEAVFTKAFEKWMNADCGAGEHPSIKLEYMGPVECDQQEYDKKKANANVIMFRDDSWSYTGTANILALTTVTYNTESGEIYDADMELNTADNQGFTLEDEQPVKFDLLSIATHETGHFLGLAHSHSGDATMFTDYKAGSTTLRDLTADDIAGICAIYPPNEPKSETCDTEPRHGFSELCAVDQPPPEEPGCGCLVAGTERGTLPGLAALLGLSALARHRRARRRETRRES